MAPSCRLRHWSCRRPRRLRARPPNRSTTTPPAAWVTSPTRPLPRWLARRGARRSSPWESPRHWRMRSIRSARTSSTRAATASTRDGTGQPSRPSPLGLSRDEGKPSSLRWQEVRQQRSNFAQIIRAMFNQPFGNRYPILYLLVRVTFA